MKLDELGRAPALGSLVILVPGGVAMIVVVRTLGAYWGRDSLASLLVATIALALGVGLLELLARQSRIASLERELRALPAAPTDGTLDLASPQLGAMLRARLEHAPIPNLAEGLAPFLTGLLVMLGLLGTLLGLFQTVSGAGHALSGSADVDALRRSLSGPLDGLTRSFGCSAAGISASAMLGLALALVRRREGRFLRAFYAYCAGPLRTLSPLQRQVRALERLSAQQHSAPGGALENAAEKLGQLASQLVELQQTALQAQQRAFSDLLASLRGEAARTSSGSAEAPPAAAEAWQAVIQRLDTHLEATRVAAAEQAQRLEAALEAGRDADADRTRRFEAAREAGRDADVELARQLQTTLEIQRAFEAERARNLETDRDADAELTRRFEATLKATRNADAEVASRFEAALQANRELEAERARRFEAALAGDRADQAQRWRALLERLDAQLELTRNSDAAAALQQLSAQLFSVAHSELHHSPTLQRTAADHDQHVATAHQPAEAGAADAAALESATELPRGVATFTSAADLTKLVATTQQAHAELLSSLAADRAQLQQTHADLASTVSTQIAKLVDATQHTQVDTAGALSATQQSHADVANSLAAPIQTLSEAAQQTSQLVGSLSAQVAQLVEATQQSQAQELGQALVARVEEVLGAEERRRVELSSAVSGELKQLFESLQQGFSQVSNSLAGELKQLLESAQVALSLASNSLCADIERRGEAARNFEERAKLTLERMEQSAALLDAAVAYQNSGMQGLIERVGALLPQLADAAQAGAVNTIAQLRESAEQHATRFAGLEASLERGREQHFAGLGAQLAAHAAALEERLTKTSEAVQEAAAIWQASSAEMQAVAESFASSAERQREASDAWLESLGAVEVAVERTGRDAAHDALSDQLASTQELFARQLQFQRELFEQLRALRGAQPRLNRGERDASL